MSYQPVATASIAILMVLGCSDCTYIFSASEAEGTGDRDGGLSADADPQAPDASSITCAPRSCDGDTLVLYRFEDEDIFADECDNNALDPDVSISGVSSLPGLGKAILIGTDTYSFSFPPSLTDSWTVDFWLRPRSLDGELLAVLRANGVFGESMLCGLKMSMVNGDLHVLWNNNDSDIDEFILSASVDMDAWNHIALTYNYPAGAGLVIDGNSIGGQSSVSACNHSATALSIGNWRNSSGAKGASADFDELRLQNVATIADFCAID